eukprot:TRINITY_DN61847_c0_g1_i1.p1 TRINITY_DN61847_c0_g1~~TRINITY_DN61847_c0_g1_i1.p1  ORF type:complete len:157 (+),score=39.83 TRINITY_DN61847_c0_g1_i1:69-539(+)
MTLANASHHRRRQDLELQISTAEMDLPAAESSGCMELDPGVMVFSVCTPPGKATDAAHFEIGTPVGSEQPFGLFFDERPEMSDRSDLADTSEKCSEEVVEAFFVPPSPASSVASLHVSAIGALSWVAVDKDKEEEAASESSDWSDLELELPDGSSS